MRTTVNAKELYGKADAVESKSDAHRALICAALCDGTTDIPIRYLNNDIEASAGCISALGAEVSYVDEAFRVKGKACGGGALDCKESGSTVRFLLPVAAMLGGHTEFNGKGKLPLRPMLPLTALLREKGCKVSSDLLPITLDGTAAGGRYVIAGDISSQFVSGLLMALPLNGEGGEILLSSPLQSKLYADMTVRVLKRFGVQWEELDADRTEGFFGGYKLIGGEYRSPSKYEVEGDWSGASFFAVAAALNGGISVCGLDMDSLQPDKEIASLVKMAGAKAGVEGRTVTFEKGAVTPFDIDVSQFPDIFPILAVLACGAVGESLLYNAARLRIKESDRIETTARMIRALGGRVETGTDYMKIYGTGSLLGGVVDGAGDHRIVMSAAVASVICRGEVVIEGSEAVNKSFPAFFDILESLGASVRHENG